MNTFAAELIEPPAAEPQEKSLEAELAEREFKPGVEPPPLRPIFTLAGNVVCTPGNITTITAAVKSGKSAVIGAMAAAAMPCEVEADLLSFESDNPKGFGLPWFDTEQSPDDSWHCVNRSLKRAGRQTPPPWLHAYHLAGLPSRRAWEAVCEALRIGADKHGGLHSVLLDGVADLVSDVNDAAESNAFVAELHGLSITYDCPIIGVIHFNPGSEKSRGHLGSQLERKAETNLALEKDQDESTVIYSTKNRRAGIPKASGPRFKFDTAAGMHVTIESRQNAKDAAERDELMDIARDMFNGRPAMHYGELATTVKKVMAVSDRTAARKVAAMKRLTVIRLSAAGLYTIAHSTDGK